MKRTLALGLIPALGLVVSLTVFVRSQNLGSQSMSSTAKGDEFSQNIQPLFNKRCVACHSCNIAPCQLNLTSYEGLSRGATKELFYNPMRSHSAPLTRLGIDATATAQWRSKGFSSVLAEGEQVPNDSILLQLTKLRINHPDLLPEEKVENSHSCPANPDDLEIYATSRPDAGMPYGLPPLSSSEESLLQAWFDHGAPAPSVSINPHIPDAFRGIESYLNAPDAKSKLVARYLFEHLFIAHIHLEGSPHARFFRLLRSSTTCESGPQEIATRRPYDDPGVSSFWYCFKPIDQTIVDKNHSVYEMGAERLKRWQQLFNATPWNVTHPSTYDIASSANPFVTFQDIPAQARYQWLLDDAQYTVMTFIKGPVCRGQNAVNVIDEQFFVLFLDPKTDHFVNDAGYAAKVMPYLRLPAASGSDVKTNFGSIRHFKDLVEDRNHYRRARDAKFTQDRPNGYSVNDIWDGGGTNDNALLTVLRHYDSAQVVRGAVGPIPKTSFVLDYPLFERIVYDLVDGFDVFGNLTHQLDTREYMSLIRAEAEENFLNFLPPQVRRPLRDFYYRGILVTVGLLISPATEMLRQKLHPTSVAYEGRFENATDPKTWRIAKQQFFKNLYEKRFTPQVRGHVDTLNSFDHAALGSQPQVATKIQSIAEFEFELSKFTGREARDLPFSNFIDDTMILRVMVDGGAADSVYTLIRNREHFNVVTATLENHYRAKKEDSMIAAAGIVTSYPNRFLVVRVEDTNRFLNMLTKINSNSDWKNFTDAFAVARSNPDFWKQMDWIQDYYLHAQPIQGGILDLSRYESIEDDRD